MSQVEENKRSENSPLNFIKITKLGTLKKKKKVLKNSPKSNSSNLNLCRNIENTQ